MCRPFRAICGLALVHLTTALRLEHAHEDDQVHLVLETQTQKRTSILNEELSGYVQRMMDLWQVKGTTIAVVRPDGEVELGAWGVRSEDGDVMTPDTLLNIASCSKAFLASSLGILMDDFEHGRNSTPLPGGVDSFTWSSKLKDLLPGEWTIMDEFANDKADLVDLLSHRTGLPRHDESYTFQDRPSDILKRLQYLKPTHELRQKWSYNNQMYIVGAHLVSKYSPTGDYTSFVTDRIFSRLEMNNTVFSPSIAGLRGDLSQSWTAHSQRIPFWYPDTAVEGIAGAGGIITNVVDLSKWLKVLLHEGLDPATNRIIVPKSAFEMATTSHTIMKGRATKSESISGYGMGWDRLSYQGHELVNHGGAIPGFSSSISFFPHDGLGIAVLMNSADKAAVNSAITLRIAEEVLQLEKLPRAEDPVAIYPPRPSRPHNASLSLPINAYDGTYSNSGYGEFTLCSPHSTSAYCTSVLTDFAIVDDAQSLPLPPPSSIPQLFAEWGRFWSTHVRLVHFDNNTFNISFTALFPDGFGDRAGSQKPFEAYEGDKYTGLAEFVLNEKGDSVLGFGLFVSDSTERETIPSDAGMVRRKSTAWFERCC